VLPCPVATEVTAGAVTARVIGANGAVRHEDPLTLADRR
jgi:hypothetical protein